MTLGHEFMASNAMNNSGLWMIAMTPNVELSDVDAIKNLGLWMT